VGQSPGVDSHFMNQTNGCVQGESSHSFIDSKVAHPEYFTGASSKNTDINPDDGVVVVVISNTHCNLDWEAIAAIASSTSGVNTWVPRTIGVARKGA